MSLTASNVTGSDTETKTNYIAVSSAAPVAEFSGSRTSGSAPLTVSFTDLSTNTPTSWSWDFGDTGSSTAQNPSHDYTSAGDYTVSLTATNAGGSDSETKVDYITATSGPTVVQCDTGDRHYNVQYQCHTGYTPAQVSKITYEYQGQASQGDTPLCLIFVHQGTETGGSWHLLTDNFFPWSTSDEWYTWETTDVSTYLGSDGFLCFELCGCPETGDNYTMPADVMRFRLELAQ